MFDDMYTKLISFAPYKAMILIPILLSIIAVPFIYLNGIPMSIDFQGGTWIEVTLGKDIDVSMVESDLEGRGYSDLRVYVGTDIETGKEKLTVITSALLNESEIAPLIREWVGGEELQDRDVIIAKLGEDSALDEQTLRRIENRFSGAMTVSFDDAAETLTFTGFDLDEDEIENVLGYYLPDEGMSFDFRERNILIDNFDPFLGEEFWKRGQQALLVAYLLMVVIVFIAFRDFIPSMAVILSATCDIVIGVAGMSLFGIQLEPLSLSALLMLVGYSVDTDIMLTTRVLKTKTGEFNDRINGAMKTGMTMTLTTFIVMVVIVVVSYFMINAGLTPMAKLNAIASVLIIGLVADVAATWLMNAGILKWYVEEKGGRFELFGRRRWKKKSY